MVCIQCNNEEAETGMELCLFCSGSVVDPLGDELEVEITQPEEVVATHGFERIQVPDAKLERFAEKPYECLECSDTGWLIKKNSNGRDCAKKCACKKRKVLEKKFAVIPPEFRDKTFENFECQGKQDEANIDAIMADVERGVYYHGAYGAGKTHLLVAQYKEVLKRKLNGVGVIPVLVSSNDLSVEFRAEALGQGSLSLSLARDASRLHLFLDDIDKIKLTETKETMLFELFNLMSLNHHRLSITSNMKSRELENLFGGATTRRIVDLTDLEIEVKR